MDGAPDKGYTHPELLVSPDKLAAELRSEGRILLLDLRPAEAFAAGHLPGAVHLDLFGISLIDTDPAPMRAFVWIIEHLLASRGVKADRPVVVYETDSGMRAARAFWFLEYFGHQNVRVLDGGYAAWQSAGLPVSADATAPTTGEWTGIRDVDRLATWRDVLDRLGHSEAVVVDTRSDGEYCGTTVRAKRGGAIPGAVHIEWTRNLASDGSFKPADELRKHVRKRRRDTGPGSDHILSGRVSRRAHLPGAASARVSAREELSGILERVGRPRGLAH